MTTAVLSQFLRPVLEPRLPAWMKPKWFSSREELLELAPIAEIGWFDTMDKPATHAAAGLATNLAWLNTMAAGIEGFPLADLQRRGVTMTCGAGLCANAIAEFAVMGMLNVAKGYRHHIRAQDARQWLTRAPGTGELGGTRALILGAGGIGARLATLLEAFDVEVTQVRRRPAPGVLGPDEWRARLGEFDWIVIFVPATPGSEGMIAAAELAAMKPGAVILNFARGSVIDQEALVASLASGHTGAAFLDVTTPEPLPADHPLWALDNVHITAHLSGTSQSSIMRRGAERFLANVARWERGEPLQHLADLAAGY